MKTVYATLLALVLVFGFTIGQASAATVTIDVMEDGYFLPGMNNWWNNNSFNKTYEFSNPNNNTYAYTKYDIAGDLSGYTADQVTSATMNFYLRKKGGAGLAPVAQGATGTFTVDAYATAPDFTPFAGSRGTLMAGTTVTYDHTMQGDVNIDNYVELVTINVTDIVKGWLSGNANFGVEIFKPGLSSDAFYWVSMEDSSAEFGAFSPYLEVSAVPIPGAVWLLGSGIAGLVGIRRKTRTA